MIYNPLALFVVLVLRVMVLLFFVSLVVVLVSFGSFLSHCFFPRNPQVRKSLEVYVKRRRRRSVTIREILHREAKKSRNFSHVWKNNIRKNWEDEKIAGRKHEIMGKK